MALFIDFDGTITSKDTISVLASACIRRNKEAERSNLERTWATIVDEYSRDYTNFAQNYEPPESLRDTVAEEAAFLEGLRTVEMRSIGRVEDSHLFRGCDSAFLHAAGERAVASGEVVIRSGFEQLITFCVSKGWKVTIVSVNWSSAFISGVLARSLGPETRHTVTIMSNDIAKDGRIIGPAFPGSADRQKPLATSRDKRDLIEKLASATVLDGSDTWSLSKVICFGDSLTDLESLISCFMSVLVVDKDDAKIMKTLQRLGYTALHISGVTFPLPPHCLAWARDFDQVLASSFFTDAIASRLPKI
jgi:thiamine phosphate phosphatase / amino-HMP aminohydrolase